MATDNIDPTVRARLAKIEMDINTLFNRKPPAGGGEAVGGLSFPLTATFPFTLADGDTSCPWTYRGLTVDFQSVIVKRKTAGAAAITFSMQVNGATVLSPTLAAGAVSAEFAFAFSLSDGYSWGVTIVSAGDGSLATLEAIPITA